VFVVNQYGLTLRPLVTPTDPQTPAQIAARARLSQANAAYSALSPTDRGLWADYALTVTVQDKRGGAPRHPAPQTLFVGLTAKFLQVTPQGSIPQTPPTSPFFGDGITLTAAAGGGTVTFTASGANAAHIVTELLLQPMAHLYRAPKPHLYRPAAFVAFAAGSLSHVVPAEPGAYAVAVRFVNALTGQASEMAKLAAVLVT
jgi:hypothetical protein